MATGSSSTRFLVVNGVPLAGDVPPVSTFLETTPGAYTTTRTHGNATVLLFWDRHLRRLADSARILAESRPDLFGSGSAPRGLPSTDAIRPLVGTSLLAGLALALCERERVGSADELAITALVRGRRGDERDDGFDVYLHIGFYAPPAFGAAGAHLAVAGPGRDVPVAKYSDWARIRKGMEKMRPPLATELLLSNDGDRILEGSVTNFFVVCRRVTTGVTDESSYDPGRSYSFEVQTAPINDGILPGVIRQLVIELCSSMGIPLREVAPSWSEHKLWVEAFVTSSLRLLQHVETIQVPHTYKELQMKTWKDVTWSVKHFEGAGFITTQIQRKIVERAGACGYQIGNQI